MSDPGGRFRDDQRSVSTTLGYSLTLAITAILMAGLLIAGGTLVEDQRERIAEEELSVSAEQLASGLGDADRLAGTVTDGVLRVYVWLPEDVAGGSYTIELQNEPTAASQPAKATILAESQQVDATGELTIRTGVPVANRTVIGGPVTVSYRDGDGDGDRELVVNKSRELAPGSPDPSLMDHEEVVYVNASTGELSSVAPDGTVTGYGVDASAIGPKQVDFDGDDIPEIPYVTAANQLRIIDKEGEIQTLASDAANSPVQNSYGSIVAIGDWRGEISVFYMNVSDTGANDEATIYRVGLNGDAEQVTVGGSAIEANAIAGFGDVNDDGDTDLVFVGTSQRIRFIDDGAENDTGQTVGANEGLGAGAIRQFDTGEVDRVPFVSSNNVKLLSYAGGTSSVTDLTTSDPAEATFVTGIDWAGDDALEVVFVDASNSSLRYVTLSGSTSTITDSDGNTITVDNSVGTA
ncbi:MAG: hypothetical protein ABEH90_00965 [Halolamina sp.]